MIHVCTDRLLPKDLAQPHVTTVNSTGRLQAIALLNKQWANGSVLSVAFMGGTTEQQNMVKAYMPQWSTHANVRFEFKSALPATIRIAFDPNDGAWSYIGTDCASIPTNQPTMNLGWQDQAVILHETGHALSLAHEHQNPSGGIQWNESQVISDLSGPPNFWDEATIRHNVIEKYRVDQIMGTAFDPASIMLYSFPANWTTNGFSAPWNQVISSVDGTFVGSPKMYPLTSVPPTLPVLPLRLAHGATLSARGELDEYIFIAPVTGSYTFETAPGPTGASVDTVLSVWQGTKQIASDDDSGRGVFSKIIVQLVAGEYRVTVKHHSASGTGKYRLIAWG